MHIPTEAEMDQALVHIERLEQRHTAMEIDTPAWKNAIWAQAGIEGWLAVARRDGCVLTPLKNELNRAQHIMGVPAAIEQACA
ncbi:hypothetical protein [Achromobacter aegrifaciens]|uniref:Uncharacterized protein n=1 Tax=Achromobacter aegrifaciens TaxID=1287736 RepID=A0AAD2IZ03_ACHAE|nr:hypothetical protein [Achromobacter aegrifaciens]CUJ01288.1 Uncharacterised protein [Achromobacter aegrifaciens]